jgi:lipid-binding SYLF domain-containing protein
MRYVCALCLSLVGLNLFVTPATARANSPDQTVQNAKAVLEEALSNPARRIPERMLADAHAVAIVPNVFKVGFIAGVRRGHGVVLVRDRDGEWGLPQFITITGGSIGWQIGAQSSDVVLVFRSQRSVENLMRGKFTLGADASVAAGPLGRRVEAATDLQLRAEILSYARSRGLFAGVALDGSAIEIDGFAHQTFYGSGPTELPRQVPQSAAALVAYVASVTGSRGTATAPAAGSSEVTLPPAPDLTGLQANLAKSATQMWALLDPNWRAFLALPADVFSGQTIASEPALAASLKNYEAVARDPAFANLAQRPEFQGTLKLLRELTAGVAASQQGFLSLPPPPGPVPAATPGR